MRYSIPDCLAQDKSREEFFAITLPQAENVVAKLRCEDPCGCLRLLTDEEIRSIYFYTTEHDEFSYKKINESLVKRDQGALFWQIEAIDSGLHKLPAHEGVCYREEDINGRVNAIAREIVSPIAQKRTVDIHAQAQATLQKDFGFFVSTTIDEKRLIRSKKPVRIHIIAKEKAKHIACASAFPDEKECLFERDAIFLVVDIEINTGGKEEVFIVLKEV